MVAAAVSNNGLSDYTFPETLDASGNTTSWLEVRNKQNHTIQFTAPGAHTAITVKAEGSLDGTYFFGLDVSGNGQPDLSGNVAFTGLPATYAITIQNRPVNYIRLKLVSYAGGGTVAGITPIKYRGG